MQHICLIYITQIINEIFYLISNQFVAYYSESMKSKKKNKQINEKKKLTLLGGPLNRNVICFRYIIQ